MFIVLASLIRLKNLTGPRILIFTWKTLSQRHFLGSFVVLNVLSASWGPMFSFLYYLFSPCCLFVFQWTLVVMHSRDSSVKIIAVYLAISFVMELITVVMEVTKTTWPYVLVASNPATFMLSTSVQTKNA